MRTVYLAHPVSPCEFAGGHCSLQSNLDHARLALSRLQRRYPEFLIYAPWLASVEAYQGDEAYRETALSLDCQITCHFDELWAVPSPITPGMLREIEAFGNSGGSVWYLMPNLGLSRDPTEWPSRLLGPDVFPLVQADLEARNEKGRGEYGGTLRALDGRDPLQDAYEETLDKAVYLRKALYNRSLR